MHFGFSYVGLILLAMLFIPNGIWVKNQPENYDKYSRKENRLLLILERIGEVLVTGLVLIFSDCNVRPRSLWIGWLILAFILMVLYECYWIRYFKSSKTMKDMYSSFAGFPVAGASLPVIAVLFLGIYALNIFIIVAAIILGVGHIGIHLNHLREINEEAVETKENDEAEESAESEEKSEKKTYKKSNKNKKKSKIKRVIKTILLAPVVLYIIICIIMVGVRNYNFFVSCIDTDKGIDEEFFVQLNDQRQYITIRGRDKTAPVIIYLHGGPGSPDSMMTYAFTNHLIDDYTVVCWDQRGCGRTYLNNDDKENKTVTFEQALNDVDALVDYLSDRFGQNKIIIMGHSYGSVLGSRYAYDHPEKTKAFIGIGQFVNFSSSAKCEYEDALEKAEAAGDDTSMLTEAYNNFVKEHTVEAGSEITRYASKYHKAERSKNTILTAFVSPTFSTDDLWWYTKQLSYEDFMRYNGNIMNYLLEVDLRKTQLSYEVPVFFISGSCDWNCAVTDMEDYAKTVGAKYDIIEGCGHYVHNDATAEFAKIVKEDLLMTNE